MLPLANHTRLKPQAMYIGYFMHIMIRTFKLRMEHQHSREFYMGQRILFLSPEV